MFTPMPQATADCVDDPSIWLQLYTMKWVALMNLMLLAACQPGVEYAEADWSTNLPAALKAADSDKQNVLLDFTGSDWCPPCKALHKQVLATKPFADYAKDNLKLVMVDFPRSKPLPKEQRQANEAMARQFKVDGFPALILLDATGKELARKDGYGGESAKEVVAWLKEYSSP